MTKLYITVQQLKEIDNIPKFLGTVTDLSEQWFIQQLRIKGDAYLRSECRIWLNVGELIKILSNNCFHYEIRNGEVEIYDWNGCLCKSSEEELVDNLWSCVTYMWEIGMIKGEED